MVRSLNINSTALEAGSYDEETQELTINFHSGASAVYTSVPNEVILELEVTPSQGRYFNQNIRGSYPEK